MGFYYRITVEYRRAGRAGQEKERVEAIVAGPLGVGSVISRVVHHADFAGVTIELTDRETYLAAKQRRAAERESIDRERDDQARDAIKAGDV